MCRGDRTVRGDEARDYGAADEAAGRELLDVFRAYDVSTWGKITNPDGLVTQAEFTTGPKLFPTVIL